MIEMREKEERLIARERIDARESHRTRETIAFREEDANESARWR